MAAAEDGAASINVIDILDTVDSASLTLDLGQPDSAKVNAWKRMPECDEFVGARLVAHHYVPSSVILMCY